MTELKFNLISEAEKCGICHVFIGVKKSKWSEWRSGKRVLPKYIKYSIEAHLLLSKTNIKKLKKSRS